MTMQQKLAQIMSRQWTFEWGDQYQAATQAVPREAPKGSRISQVNSRKLGRALHALSTPERVFIQLALYHPNLLDLHEQRALWPYPSSHPLRGHPLVKGTFPAPLRGTKEIAAEIGFKHFEIPVEDANGRRSKLPFPYQGDLLLYLLRSDGTPYALNWSIKDSAAAFQERRWSAAKTPAQQRKDRDHAELRGELERIYYSSGGIRTLQLSLEDVGTNVIANLELLFPLHAVPLTLESNLLNDYSAEIKASVEAGEPVSYVALRYGKRWGARDQFIARIYQDIWARRLPVTLFEPVLIDQPLNTTGDDLLESFGYMFEETFS